MSSNLPARRNGDDRCQFVELLAAFVVDTNETEMAISFRELRFNTFRAEI